MGRALERRLNLLLLTDRLNWDECISNMLDTLENKGEP